MDGRAFDGAAELRELIRTHERFPTCLTRQLMTHGLGRGLVPDDDCFVEQASADVACGEYA